VHVVPLKDQRERLVQVVGRVVIYQDAVLGYVVRCEELVNVEDLGPVLPRPRVEAEVIFVVELV